MNFQLPKASDGTTREQRDVPDEGLHIVKFKGWTEPAQSIYQNDRTGEYPMTTRFLFDLVSDISGGTYPFEFEAASKHINIPEGSMGKRSNMRLYIEAIMGRALQDGEAPPDLEDLIGKQAVVDFIHNVVEYEDGPITYANIKTITAHKSRQRAAVVKDDPFPETLSA